MQDKNSTKVVYRILYNGDVASGAPRFIVGSSSTHLVLASREDTGVRSGIVMSADAPFAQALSKAFHKQCGGAS